MFYRAGIVKFVRGKKMECKVVYKIKDAKFIYGE